MSQIKRQSCSASKGFGAATISRTNDVPLAIDNLVCVKCGVPLGEVEWAAVSTPKHKGIVAFACKPHVSYAMNLLSQLFEMAEVPETLTLPDEKNN